MITWHARIYNLRKYRSATAYAIKPGKSGTRRSPWGCLSAWASRVNDPVVISNPFSPRPAIAPRKSRTVPNRPSLWPLPLKCPGTTPATVGRCPYHLCHHHRSSHSGDVDEPSLTENALGQSLEPIWRPSTTSDELVLPGTLCFSLVVLALGACRLIIAPLQAFLSEGLTPCLVCRPLSGWLIERPRSVTAQTPRAEFSRASIPFRCVRAQ